MRIALTCRSKPLSPQNGGNLPLQTIRGGPRLHHKLNGGPGPTKRLQVPGNTEMWSCILTIKSGELRPLIFQHTKIKPGSNFLSLIWVGNRQAQGGMARPHPINLISTMLWTLVGLGFGCSLFPEAKLERWKGLHREDLVQMMGTPTTETALPDGGQRLEFFQRITQHPLGGQVYGTTYQCHRIFEVDATGIIQTASETGC